MKKYDLTYQGLKLMLDLKFEKLVEELVEKKIE
jgi:hypothetical protein